MGSPDQHIGNQEQRVRRGGRREGAGRRPKGRRAGRPHTRRETMPRERCPVHVTLRVKRHVLNLRSRHAFRAVRRALQKGQNRFGVHLTQFSVQPNHIHLIVEASDTQSLTRAMKGLSVRIARAMNKVMKRSGRVIADRFHAHVLRTPGKVRNAIRYVKENSKRHAERRGRKWLHEIDSGTGGPCTRRFPKENREVVMPPTSRLLLEAWLWAVDW